MELCKLSCSEDHYMDKVYRKQTRKRLIIIGVSTVVLIAVMIGAVVGMTWHQKNRKLAVDQLAAYTATQSIPIMCDAMAQYPDSCNSTMISLLISTNNSDNQNLNTKQFLMLSMQVSNKELVNTSSILSSYANGNFTSLVQDALDNCETLTKDAIDNVNKSLETGQELSTATLNDIITWLSAAVDDQKTCSDGLKSVANTTELADNNDDVLNTVGNSTIVTSNSLEIASYIMKMLGSIQTPAQYRKLLAVNGGGGAWRSIE